MDMQERYAVYHANDLPAVEGPLAAHWYADRARHYTHVADVAAPLGRVFSLTNHIDHPWTDNPEVICSRTGEAVRSTSVGDVVVSLVSGQAWLVMPIGLQELAPENAQRTESSGGEDSQPSSVERRTAHDNDGNTR